MDGLDPKVIILSESSQAYRLHVARFLSKEFLEKTTFKDKRQIIGCQRWELWEKSD